MGAQGHVPGLGQDRDGRRPGGRGPTRARVGEAVPYRWSAGVAQEAVMERVREFTLLNSQQDEDLSLPLFEWFQGLAQQRSRSMDYSPT